MARGGIRVGEVLKLRSGDVDDRKLSLQDPKSGRQVEIVFIPQKVMSRLYQYIKNHVSKAQSKDQNIFNIGERRWKQILSKESNKILGRHINPHLFRHSCNQWLRSKGWDVKERQRYLGHENPSTTMIYDHTNQDDLSKKFDNLF